MKLLELLKVRWDESMLKKESDINLEDFALLLDIHCCLLRKFPTEKHKIRTKTLSYTKFRKTSQHFQNEWKIYNYCEKIPKDFSVFPKWVEVEQKVITVTKKISVGQLWQKKCCITSLGRTYHKFKCRSLTIWGKNSYKLFHNAPLLTKTYLL